MFLKRGRDAFSTFCKFCTPCILHCMCAFSLHSVAESISLFPFHSHSCALGRKWKKVAIEFPSSGGVWNRKKVQGHSASLYLKQTLNAALIHYSALPLPHILVSKSPPLRFWNKLFHFFLVRSIFIRLCGAPQLLSLWRALMNVLGSHPLIIPALNAFRYTLTSGCLKCT